MGGIGAGITTAIINTFSALCLMTYFYQREEYKRYWFRLFLRFTPELKRVFLVGMPVGLALFVEMVFLDIITFGTAPLGTSAIASNNIMLNITTIIFTITSGIASVATVRISVLSAKKDIKVTSIFGYLTIATIGAISVLACFIIYFSLEILFPYTLLIHWLLIQATVS